MMRAPLWQKIAATSVMICSALAVSACNDRRSSHIILYDQEWSRSAGIANLKCAPEVRDSCRKEAISGEISFASDLASSFKSSPNCKGIEFLVDPGSTSPSQQMTVDYGKVLRTEPVFGARMLSDSLSKQLLNWTVFIMQSATNSA